MLRFDIVLGTRPEIIKLAPVVRRLAERDIAYRIIHTGQHYDPQLDGVFFRELNLPEPYVNYKAGGVTQGLFFATLFPALEELWTREPPSAVIVQGDTNSAFAGAFIGQRMGLPVAHVEAGLRSYDRSMPEEVNRVLIDHIAVRHYVPTARQASHLASEGIDASSILVTGNTVADAVREHQVSAQDALLSFDLPDRYAVLTLHRPALVDDADRLNAVLDAVDGILESENLVGIFPVHPRTHRHLTGIVRPAIRMVEPIGYLPMLRLLSGSSIVVTDSGGLQEEAAILRVRCVTLRENTERPETVDAGGNVIAGIHPAEVAPAIAGMLRKQIDWKPLYDQPNPSDIIVDDLISRFGA